MFDPMAGEQRNDYRHGHLFRPMKKPKKERAGAGAVNLRLHPKLRSGVPGVLHLSAVVRTRTDRYIRRIFDSFRANITICKPFQMVKWRAGRDETEHHYVIVAAL